MIDVEEIVIRDIRVTNHAAERFNERILKLDSPNELKICKYIIKESLDNRIHKVIRRQEDTVFIKRKNAQFVIRDNLILTVIEAESKENYSQFMKLPAGFKPFNKTKKYDLWLEKEFEIVDTLNLITAVIKDIKNDKYYTYNFKSKKLKLY